MSERESIISRFHNQKEGDFDPETGAEYSTTTPHHKNYLKIKEEKELEYKVGKAEKLERQIRNVISLIKNSELNLSSMRVMEQENILRKIKDEALEKIAVVLDNILEYKNSIIALDSFNVEKDRHDQKTYLDLKTKYDEGRKLKHNILISNLLSAIKFIAYNFSTISETALERWIEEQEERGLPIADVKRQKFPDKIICPDNLNLKDREQIAAWAIQLADSLSVLKKELPC